MAPQVYDGKVFVGITGAGYGLHLEIQEDGKKSFLPEGLVAYDTKTGKELWR